ncbi:MAG: exo-alpha-sialidase [Clostridia bacterium]|nr:exo-alpha-sialidase [Clostridia bacterium]
MKPQTRFRAAVLATLLLALPFSACAAGAGPFEPGTLGCERFRIPALLTLHDGSVLAGADLRWDHGTDAPQNIDIAAAVSPDGYDGWVYSVPNRLDDYADGVSGTQSAAYIDSALLQSESGRVFMLCDLFPSGTGYPNAKKGSGCVTVDGRRYLALAKAGSQDDRYSIADFAGAFAPVMENGRPTAYSVDRNYRLYKDGALCTLAQKGSGDAPTGETVAQSVFYAASDLHVFPTSYLCLRHSDDGGRTWSAPTLLNPMVKHDKEAFLGVCPGRGVSIRYDGHERLIFPVYSNERGREHALTIWSDDGGVTWQRGADVRCSLLLQKTSESQIITLPDGTLRMFSRNGSHFIGRCDSTDGGVSWTKAKPDPALCGTKNCMVSFVNTSHTVGGRPVVLCSMGSNVKSRADGVIRVGVIEADNRIDWISACPVNSGFFAYSCLTELADGSIALLFEDGAAHFSYRIFTLNADGTLTPADGAPPADMKQPSFADRLLALIGKIITVFSRK